MNVSVSENSSHILRVESIPVRTTGNGTGTTYFDCLLVCFVRPKICFTYVKFCLCRIIYILHPSLALLIEWKSSFDPPEEDGYFPTRRLRGRRFISAS